MPFADWTEEWWGSVMDVELDPELSKMVRVRVVRPNLLFCIHQRDSEGICRGEGKCRRLSWAERVVRRVVWGYREEEVSHESIQEGFKEIEVVVW